MRPIVRPARPEDAAGIARVHGDAWRAAYRGIVPDGFLATRGREPDAVDRRRRWIEDPKVTTLVAEEGGEILGFANGGPSREGPAGFDGELYAIYIHPSRQRERLGWRLLLHLAEALHGRGFRSLSLWVLRDNAAGRAFYERVGGRVVAEKEIEIGGARLVETAYGWPDLSRLLRMRVRLAPPDPAWPARFAEEAARLREALGEEAVAVEHIGSTAVPGLPAKPVVDIQLGLLTFPMGSATMERILSLGWEFNPAVQDIEGRQYFARGHPRDFHLHACLHGGAFWRSHVAFRDALRGDTALAREYEALKRRLAAEVGDDRIAYLRGKAPFIGRVIRDAGGE
ncbi:MAG: GNAT family N-acetyltransferase [Planctomycetaceae bacterium]|nr:bifunctional GNAT family N-acetyltransferase/GrpB family protein [Planctomycetota bacterium]NUN51644.1 GNAT family N-acetyltransferase [Planctomycetaceae bacterium]